MDFREAERYINISLLFGKPSLLIVGTNGIGKTAMVKEIGKKFKSARVVGDIDYGGLRQRINEMVALKQNTIVLEDLGMILGRKGYIKDSAFMLMSNLITDGITNSMTFSKEMTDIKAKNINFIVASTYQHITKMVQERRNDLLNRFVILEINRKDEDFNEEEFELKYPVIKKLSKEGHVIYKNYKKVKYSNIPRFSNSINDLIRGFNAIGINGINHIIETKPLVFNPADYDEPIDLSLMLKPILDKQKIEEINKKTQSELNVK
jgi:Cdc6-like AAA superfamily ATPase